MRTGEQAIAAMRKLIEHPNAAVKKGNQCLAVVRAAFDAPFIGAANAAEGWDKSEKKHRGDTNPPRGMICWQNTSSDDDHVFISLGDGRGIGTDFPKNHRIGTFKISRIIDAWGPFKGWTECYGSTPIPVPAGQSGQPVVSMTKLLQAFEAQGTLRNSGVAVVQLALEKAVDAELTNFGKGFWGPKTRACNKAWEHKLVHDAHLDLKPDGKPTKDAIVRLGQRFGFRVVN